jgi:hypothetical protein
VREFFVWRGVQNLDAIFDGSFSAWEAIMAILFWILVIIFGALIAWITNSPQPSNRYIDAIQKYFPLIVVVIGLWLIVRGFVFYGLGLIFLYVGLTVVTKAIQRRRLKKLDPPRES